MTSVLNQQIWATCVFVSCITEVLLPLSSPHSSFSFSFTPYTNLYIPQSHLVTKPTPNSEEKTQTLNDLHLHVLAIEPQTQKATLQRNKDFDSAPVTILHFAVDSNQ